MCNDRIPKISVNIELSENSEMKWQIEWDFTTKGVTTKLYFPKVADRLTFWRLTTTIVVVPHR